MRSIVFVSVLAAIAIAFSGILQALPEKLEATASASGARVLVTDGNADIVVQADGHDSFREVLDLAFSHGAKVKFADENSGIVTLKKSGLSDALLNILQTTSGIESVSSELKVRALFTPNDPDLGQQWGLDTINAYQAWDITRGNHSVVVGELDTGIDWNHPDLAANIWNDSGGYHGYNFVANNRLPMDDNINSYDEAGRWQADTYTYHGTHVAGVIGAVINNNLGVAGIAQARLMAVKVMNDSGEGTDAWVASGLRWAVDNGADIITMSLGVDGMSLVLSSAVNYASSHGVVMVAASGNSGASIISYPAAYPPVIAVGAVDETSRRASFSDWGTGLDLMAPGMAIYSTQGGGGYHSLSGTSTAAPFVAGVCALMLTMNPALTPVELGQVLNSTATDISLTGYDTTTGWGVVNAFKAVEQISGPTVTITKHPSYAPPNSTFSITWMVSGGSPGTISDTYLAWGETISSLDHRSQSFTGTTWEEFTVNSIVALTSNGTMYIQAFATVDGTLYRSDLLPMSVHKAIANNPISQFLQSLGNFIVHDMGVFNFMLLLVVLIAIPAVVIGMRSRRRHQLAAMQRAYMPPPNTYQPLVAAPLPPPPPPPPRFEAYIDLVGHDVMPASIKVVEGTKVVWVNRSWAPPPGIAIRSGRVDSAGEHPDGAFQSGLLIAPGDYWSATFHKAGTYDYYLTGIWKPGRVIVEPLRLGETPMASAA